MAYPYSTVRTNPYGLCYVQLNPWLFFLLCLLMVHPNLRIWNSWRILSRISVTFWNMVLQISLRCAVCDTSARALVRGTKLCSGYFGCDKYAEKGVWEGRVVYPLVKDINLRTDFLSEGRLMLNTIITKVLFVLYLSTWSKSSRLTICTSCA